MRSGVASSPGCRTGSSDAKVPDWVGILKGRSHQTFVVGGQDRMGAAPEVPVGKAAGLVCFCSGGLNVHVFRQFHAEVPSPVHCLQHFSMEGVVGTDRLSAACSTSKSSALFCAISKHFSTLFYVVSLKGHIYCEETTLTFPLYQHLFITLSHSLFQKGR